MHSKDFIIFSNWGKPNKNEIKEQVEKKGIKDRQLCEGKQNIQHCLGNRTRILLDKLTITPLYISPFYVLSIFKSPRNF